MNPEQVSTKPSMSAPPTRPRPLKSPLDLTVSLGWTSWTRTAVRAGFEPVRDWLQKRINDDELLESAVEPLTVLLTTEDPEERAVAAAELAELLDNIDDVLADTLWEGVHSFGRTSNDADFLFEATSRLAAIAERHGDVLAAAEFYIDFLNWRREDEHTSEPEQVETAFEEIVRLAELDDAPRSTALYSFYHTRFRPLVESDDELASTGDWDPNRGPFAAWE